MQVWRIRGTLIAARTGENASKSIQQVNQAVSVVLQLDLARSVLRRLPQSLAWQMPKCTGKFCSLAFPSLGPCLQLRRAAARSSSLFSWLVVPLLLSVGFVRLLVSGGGFLGRQRSSVRFWRGLWTYFEESGLEAAAGVPVPGSGCRVVFPNAFFASRPLDQYREICESFLLLTWRQSDFDCSASESQKLFLL